MVLIIFLITSLVNCLGEELYKIYQEINSEYDLKYPILNSSIVKIKSHHRGKRCVASDPSSAVDMFLAGKWAPLFHGRQILVNSPCLGSDSFGNYLGSYFESIACANKVGLDYISVAKVYEPKTAHAMTSFISYLPNYIENKNTYSFKKIKSLLQIHCQCPSNCHEQRNAEWINGLDIIKPIISNVLLKYLNLKLTKKNTIVEKNDLSTVPYTTKLPLIPDVAIHYRCGDNFVGYYGFLRFHVFKDKIPFNSKYIYILAEKRTRKTSKNPDLAMKCDSILHSLSTFLKLHFPNSVILVKRGDNLYIDMVRFAYARTTICSVSTFCLWPGIVNNGTVYFPRTKLIAGGDVTVPLGFIWLDEKDLILGAENLYTPARELVYKLGGKYLK
mmetsp:Transcript_32282/g.30777  ORF Transcript_32282/g.30777 Transcript_32282/m.30777 type:complete len:387 (+) Transcript_32282:371-1531(+)